MSAKTGIEGKPHRFLTFQEQLSKIEIKFSRQDGSLDRFAENAATKSGSHFSDACLQWRETNLSQEYSDFCREVYNISGDLALLVLNQKTVVDILIRYVGVLHCVHVMSGSDEPNRVNKSVFFWYFCSSKE